MNIKSDWTLIRSHFNKSFKTSLSVAIASVDVNNNPTIMPIGTLFLNGDISGFYFEKYPSKLPINVKLNRNICVMGVNSSKWYWLRALFNVKFSSPPAIRLYGTIGERRKATTIEISRLNKRMKVTTWLKGNKYLWGKMEYVRDIQFSDVEGVNIGKMTK